MVEKHPVKKLTLGKNIKLKKGTRQGDPISAYIFILVLEIVLAEIRSN